MSAGLLIKESPLQVIPSLAIKLGIDEAIVLQQVHYRLGDDHKFTSLRLYKEGFWWFPFSFEEWHKEEFKWWSIPTIKRIFLTLESMGLLISRQFDKANGSVKGNCRKYYRVDYGRVSLLEFVPIEGWNERTDKRIGLINEHLELQATLRRRSYEEPKKTLPTPSDQIDPTPPKPSDQIDPKPPYPSDQNDLESANPLDQNDPIFYIERSLKEDLINEEDLNKSADAVSDVQARVNLPTVEVIDQNGSTLLTVQNNSSLSSSGKENKDPGEDRSSGAAVATKTKEPKTAEDFEILMNLYNEHKPPVWSKCSLLNDFRVKRFRSLWKMYKDDLAQTWIDALEYASKDHWWKDKPFTIDTILREGKVTELAEKNQASSNKPAAIYEDYDRALSEKGEFF